MRRRFFPFKWPLLLWRLLSTQLARAALTVPRLAKSAFRLVRLVRAMRESLFHYAIKLLALFGCEDGLDLLVDALHFFAQLRLKLGAHLPDAFLTFNHELLNFVALFGRELELTIKTQDKLAIQ